MKPKFRPFLILAANVAETPVACAANADGGGAVFAIAQPDSMFIPYGEWPHKLGRQIFDRAAAEAMVGANSGFGAKVLSLFSGRKEFPIYVGHPDIPGSKDADKKAYGWGDAAGMTAGNDGLTIPVRYTDEGRSLVESGAFRFYSPAWWLSNSKRGKVPVGIKSIGLTNDPNIPVPALSNEADETGNPDGTDGTDATGETTTTNEESMKEKLLALLGLSPETSDDDCLAAVSGLKDQAAKLADAESAKDAAMSEKETAENACADEKKRADMAENERDAATARVETLVQLAVNAAMTEGRVLPADVETKTAEILACNDVAAALQALRTAPAVMKTTSAIGDLGSAKSTVLASNSETARREERATLVANEYAALPETMSHGERKRRAWQKATAKHPDVFGKSSTAATA